MDPVVAIRRLEKRYGKVAAVRGLDLEVPRGEVFALLGPNGAGKTTTVEILEGYRRRSGGKALVLGEDPERGGRRWRARIGIVPQTTTVFDDLTVGEVVGHFARLYPDPLDPGEAIDLVGLGQQHRRTGARLSGGQRRRLDLAVGIVGNPELLFLDEPTTGMDPAARRQAWELIKRLASLGRTVLLTSHYLDEAEALADRVGVIVNGRPVEIASPRELGGRAHADARVVFKAEGPLAARPLPPLPAAEVAVTHGLVSVHTNTPTAVVAALVAWVAGAGLAEIPELTVSRPTLEDVYLRMIAAAEPAA